MSIHEQMRIAQTREAESIFAAYERSPREFAKVFSDVFPYAFMGLAEQRKLRAYEFDRPRLERQIVEETEAATSLWAIWKQWRTNDAALTGNERNLARVFAQRVEEAADSEAERNVESFGVDGLRVAGAL